MKLPLSVNILLGFAPYIAFFIVLRAVSVEVGLWAALTVAVPNAGRDWLQSRSLKVLEIGNVALFLALAAFTAIEHWEWSVMAVRLAVDTGLLAVVLASLAIGQPFTLQYARQRVPKEYWQAPLFLAINRHITWGWAAAFAALVAAHAAVVFVPDVPVWSDIAVTVIALTGALRFSTSDTDLTKAFSTGGDHGPSRRTREPVHPE
jgi:hypothetical protein